MAGSRKAPYTFWRLFISTARRAEEEEQEEEERRLFVLKFARRRRAYKLHRRCFNSADRH